jgi:hypothetical protein
MLYLFAFLFVLNWELAPSLRLQPTGCPTDQQAGMIIDQVIALSPSVPVQASGSQRHLVFLRQEVELDLQAGQQVYLAGSADGQGVLVTDDLAHLEVSPSGLTWEHDFRNAARLQIIPIPPQDISTLFQPGRNQLVFTTQDLFPPEYRSSAYFLIILTPCAMPTATPSPSPTATFTPVPRNATSTWTSSPVPTIAQPDTPTPQPPTVTPLPTATPPPTATETRLPPIATAVIPTLAAIPAPPPESGPGVGGLPPLLGGLGVGITGLYLWRIRRPRPGGEGEIYQEGRFVTGFNLNQLRKSKVTLGRRADISLLESGLPDVIGRFTAQRTTEGTVETVLTLLAHDGQDVEETIVLHHEDEVVLGQGYRLRYVNYAIQDTSLITGEHYV